MIEPWSVFLSAAIFILQTYIKFLRILHQLDKK